jgi:hypothetical protein
MAFKKPLLEALVILLFTLQRASLIILFASDPKPHSAIYGLEG